MIAAHSIDTLTPEQLRQALHSALAEVQRHERQAAHNRALIDKLIHEMAVPKRLKFAAKSESFNAEQKSLLEDARDADLAALAQEIEQREPAKASPGEKRQTKRCALPPSNSRTELNELKDSHPISPQPLADKPQRSESRSRQIKTTRHKRRQMA